jgi:RNA polymerase sigma factor (TIGR02999 family)
MSDVTRILQSIEDGDPKAAAELLPLVYEELRKLAAAKMAQENPGHTLQSTALVHDAYLRLVDVDKARHWDSRGHFFSAAAEAMRRILVESARRKARVRHGAGRRQIEMSEIALNTPLAPDDLLALDEALDRLQSDDPAAAELVRLRFFAGMSMQEAADVIGIPLRTAERNWAYARTRLHQDLSADDSDSRS